MKLFRSPELPGHWVGEDQHGALVVWPAQPGGWALRTPYTGGKRQLEEVEPALARGTRWPGAGRAPRPRASSGAASSRHVGLRATPEEHASWLRRAGEERKRLSDWARDELNAAAVRPRSKGPGR